MSYITKSPIMYREIVSYDFKKISNIFLFQNPTEQYIYFDYNSKGIFLFDQKLSILRIFNRNITKLIKEVHFIGKNYFSAEILKLTADSSFSYLLLYREEKKTRNIVILDLNKASYIKSIEGQNWENIEIIIIDNGNKIYSVNEINICLAFSNRVMFYKVFNNGTDVKLIEHIELKEKRYTKFVYNKNFKILCAQDGDSEKNKEIYYDLFNLQNERFYKKTYTFKIKQKIIKDYNNKNTKYPSYVQTQIFLEDIYSQLYFIRLSYIEETLSLYYFENSNIEKIKLKAQYKLDGSIFTLQFIDNLMLMHNLSKSDTIIVDLMYKAGKLPVIWRRFQMVNYYSHLKNELLNNHNCNNNDEEIIKQLGYQSKILPIIYRRKIEFNEKCIIETVKEENKDDNSIFKVFKNNKIIYNLYLSPMILYKVFRKKKEAAQILSRRKNSKDFLFKSFQQEMLTHELKYSSFNTIAEYLVYIMKLHQESLQLKLKTTTTSGIDIIKDPSKFFPSKKHMITQEDFCQNFFNKLKENTSIKPEVLIYFYTCFYEKIKVMNIAPSDILVKTLIQLIKLLNDLSRIKILFTNYSIEDNRYIANFLINDIALNDLCNFSLLDKKFAYQTGMDIFKRIKNYIEIGIVLINQNKIGEFLIFIKNVNVSIKVFEKEYLRKIAKFVFLSNKKKIK